MRHPEIPKLPVKMTKLYRMESSFLYAMGNDHVYLYVKNQRLNWSLQS